jgi:hypothetical protein
MVLTANSTREFGMTQKAIDIDFDALYPDIELTDEQKDEIRRQATGEVANQVDDEDKGEINTNDLLGDLMEVFNKCGKAGDR